LADSFDVARFAFTKKDFWAWLAAYERWQDVKIGKL
jgi:hypothetical protein